MCWLGGRKGIRPVKTEWWGAGVVICLERGADLHTTQLMPLPLTISCFSEIQIGFTFLVSAHPRSPGQSAVKLVCVCVRVRVCVRVCNKLVRCCCVQKFVHELRINYQVMYLNPSVKEVRVNVLGELRSWQDNILTLPRVTHSRYQASCRHLV